MLILYILNSGIDYVRNTWWMYSCDYCSPYLSIDFLLEINIDVLFFSSFLLMDYASQNMEWLSVTHNTQPPPHLTCKHACLSLLEMHLTEARFASCFVMWKQMQSPALCPCLSVLLRVGLYKGHICFIKAVRELNRCDSNLLVSHQRCILTNPSGPVCPTASGGRPCVIARWKNKALLLIFPSY